MDNVQSVPPRGHTGRLFKGTDDVSGHHLKGNVGPERDNAEGHHIKGTLGPDENLDDDLERPRPHPGAVEPISEDDELDVRGHSRHPPTASPIDDMEGHGLDGPVHPDDEPADDVDGHFQKGKLAPGHATDDATDGQSFLGV